MNRRKVIPSTVWSSQDTSLRSGVGGGAGVGAGVASITSNSQMVNGLFSLNTWTRIFCPVPWQGTTLVSFPMSMFSAHGLSSTDTVKGLSLSEQQSCRFVILMADIVFGLPISTCHQGFLLVYVWVQLLLLQKPSPLPSMARLGPAPCDVDD